MWCTSVARITRQPAPGTGVLVKSSPRLQKAGLRLMRPMGGAWKAA
ncbi:MAG TPA: hypothetical protein VFO85_16940 [Vicinamibacteria bacterium]|nr:hypothetical protein [Vicinamibacteria bacterium]